VSSLLTLTMGHAMNCLRLACRLLLCTGLAALLGFSEVQGAEPGKADLPGLKRAARSATAAVSAPARAALGAYYRGQKKYTEAAKWTADSAALAETNLEWPRVLVFTEHARIRAAAGAPGEALEMLDYAVKRTSGLPLAVALAGQSDVLAGTTETVKAKAAIDAALTAGDVYFKREKISDTQDGPAKPLDKEWQALRPGLVERQLALEERLLVETYGLDYVLYKKAQELRRAGKLKAAAKRYEELQNLAGKSVYGAAAEFYRGQCFGGKDATERQLAYFQELCKRSPDSPYAGEAMLEAGTLCLREFWDGKRAAPWFRNTMEWCRTAAANQRQATLYTIPDKSRTVSAPTADSRKIDQWGIIRDEEPAADKLVNGLTASWYLRDLERRARYRLAFCLMTQEQWDEAKAVLNGVLNIDPLVRQQDTDRRPSAFLRLNKVCDLKKFVAEPLEIAAIPKDRRVQVCYGDFLYLDRQFDAALAVYQAVYEQGKKERCPPLAAAGLLGIAQAKGMKDPRDKTCLALLEQVVTDYPREKAAGRAAFYLANRVGEVSEPARQKRALELYMLAVKMLPPDSAIAENSLAFSVDTMLSLGRNDEARRTADLVLKRYPKTNWKPMMDAYFKRHPPTPEPGGT
jgi:TolA-binding protein